MIGYYYLYLTRFGSFYPIFICWASSCLLRLLRKNKEERCRKKDIFLISTLFRLRFSHGYSVARKYLPVLFEDLSFFPNQALKYVSHLRCLISQNSVFLVVGDKSLLVLLISAVVSWDGCYLWKGKLACHNVDAGPSSSSRKKYRCFQSNSHCWKRAGFFLVPLSSFSSIYSLNFLSGASGSFYIYFEFF